MKQVLLLLIISLHCFHSSPAQIQIGMNKKVVSSRITPITEDAYNKFLGTKTVFLIHPQDMEIRDAIEYMIRQVWTLTPFVLDTYSSIGKYRLLGNYSFFSINPNITQINLNDISGIERAMGITWDLWMYGDKQEEFEITLAKIPLIFNPKDDVYVSYLKIISFYKDLKVKALNDTLKHDRIGTSFFFPPLVNFYLKHLQDHLKPGAALPFYTKRLVQEDLKNLGSEYELLIPDKTELLLELPQFQVYAINEVTFFKPSTLSDNYKYRYSIESYSDLIKKYYETDESYYLFGYGHFRHQLYYYILDARQNRFLLFNTFRHPMGFTIYLPFTEFRKISKYISNAG